MHCRLMRVDCLVACMPDKYFVRPYVATECGVAAINLKPEFPVAEKWILWALDKGRVLFSICKVLKVEIVMEGRVI